MVVVADASVAIRGDLSGFHRDLRGAEAQTGTLGQKLKSALSPRNIIGAAGILGIGLGLRQLVGAAGEAAEEFQALQQTTRTVDAVFGDSAGVIHAWGETAAEAAGLSKREVNEAAAVMGQTLLNMGFSADEAAARVVQLQQRAADLALAFGRDPQDAILAITAAMRGERDTIEKFGVSIKQADVNSRVLALGLDTSTAAAKKNAEAVAILDIILDQSASSADRFATSQDDVAVKMAKAEANAQNVQAAVGEMFTEIQNGAFIVGDAIGDAFGAIGQFIDETSNPATIAKVERLADALGVSAREARDQVHRAMEDTGQTWDTTIDDMLVAADELQAGSWYAYQEVASAAAEGMASARATTEAEAERIANAIPEAVLENWQDIRQAGVDTQLAYNAGIFDTQGAFLAEIDALLKALDEALAPGEEIAELRGRKMMLMEARGINAGNPFAIAAIDQQIAAINQRLATLNGYQYGANIPRTIAAGMYAEAWQVGQAAGYVASKIQGPLQIRSEPPDHTSPLYGITQWGPNIVKTIAGGIFGELGTGSAAASALAGALVPSLGNVGSMTGPAGVNTGQTIQYVLNVDGKPKQVGSEHELWEAFATVQFNDRSLIR